MGKMELSKLSEDCIALIISFTSPKDACRSSLVSRSFKSASDFDSVWEKFLPFDYRQLLSQSTSFPPEFFNSMTKKDLYFYLCHNPIIIGDDRNMSFSLDKSTGKKCIMIGARGLSITWSDTPEYWKWISLPESRFTQVVKLRMVWWLHVNGRFETRSLSPQTTYEAFFVFKLSQHSNFKDRPVQLFVHFEGRENTDVTEVILDPSTHVGPLIPRERGYGWKEIKMGEFFNENGEDGLVSSNMKEVSGHQYWSGLTIEGIEVRPKVE